MAEQGDPRLGAPALPDAIRTALDAARRQAAAHSADVALGLLAAVCVAAVGWLFALAVTFAVWIPTAPSGSGVGGPFHVAGQLWLSAHHVLLRTPDGLFGLTPLGFTTLPAAAMVMAGRYAGQRHRVLAGGGGFGSAGDGDRDWDRDRDRDRDWDWDRDAAGDGAADGAADGNTDDYDRDAARELALGAVWLTGAAAAGYGLCAELVAWTAASGPLHADLRACISYPPLLAAAGFGTGFLTVRRPRLDRWALAAGRAAMVSATILVGGAALLAAFALALRFQAVGEFSRGLGGGAAASTGLFLIDLALLPNLLGWALSFLTGPGFAVGAGSTVSVFGSVHGPLPGLPVLAAIPASGPLSPWLLTVGLVPILAGVAAAVLIGRQVPAGPDRFAALAAATVGAGLACGLFASLSGGPVAAGAMAVTGPSGWQVALASGGLLALAGLAWFGVSAALALAGISPAWCGPAWFASAAVVSRPGSDPSVDLVTIDPVLSVPAVVEPEQFDVVAPDSLFDVPAPLIPLTPFALLAGSVLDGQGPADLVGEGAVAAVPERGEEAHVAGQGVEDVSQAADEGQTEAGGLHGGLLQDPDADGLLADGLPGGALPVELPEAEREDDEVAQELDGHAGAGGPAEADQVPFEVVGGRLDALVQGEVADDEHRAHDQAVYQSGGDAGAPGGELDG